MRGNNQKAKGLLTLKLFFLLTIILLSFSLISAAEINFTKNSNSFDRQETLIAKVSANFVEQPTAENVFFYRNNNVPVAVDYEISKIKEDFYIYALLDLNKLPGNYSLVLKNVRYMKGAMESEENIVKNFIITENTSDFSVTPGFIGTLQDFSLEVQNLQDGQITILITKPESLLAPSSINVNSGDIKWIDFVQSGQGSSSDFVKLSSTNTEYSIPVLISSNITSNTTSNESSQENTSIGEEGLIFEPDNINISIATNSTSKRILYILNSGKTNLENLTFSVPSALEPYVKINSSKKIGKNSTEKVEITITSDLVERFVEGNIIARAGNITSSLEVSLNFVKDYIPPVEEKNGTEPLVLTICEQLNGGKVCALNQTCNGDSAIVSDGVCCRGTCEEVKKSSTGKIIGWTLVAIVIILLLWFLKKYKKVKPKVDLLKIRER